jgi:RHS repeat-associated protein
VLEDHSFEQGLDDFLFIGDHRSTTARIFFAGCQPVGFFLLGADRSLTNRSRADANARTNYPFLTLKERDIETGLDYFLARNYSNVQGRFTSVDPENAGAYAGNPQTWNGYGYAINQPMLYTDPDGLKVKICGTDGQCTSGGSDLSDENWDRYFRQDKSIKLKNGNIYKNGTLIGTYDHYSCDSCLFDTVGLARQVVAADPGRNAVRIWVASVIAGLSGPFTATEITLSALAIVLVRPDEEGEDAVAGSIKADRQYARVVATV